METVIEVKNLSVKYGLVVALKNVSFQIKRNDFVALVGPNDGGKNTLAKALLGLLPLSYRGKIIIFNKDIKNFRHWYKVGYLPQKQTDINPLFPATVAEIVSLGLLSTKKYPKRINHPDWQKIELILKNFAIYDLKDKPITELSGGEQQKVMLARALVCNPEILILDEPSTALDPSARQQFFDYLKKLNKEEETTIILITHDIAYIDKSINKLLYIDQEVFFLEK